MARTTPYPGNSNLISSEDIIQSDVYGAANVQRVAPLRAGLSLGRECEPQKPFPDAIEPAKHGVATDASGKGITDRSVLMLIGAGQSDDLA